MSDRLFIQVEYDATLKLAVLRHLDGRPIVTISDITEIELWNLIADSVHVDGNLSAH